MQTWLKFVQGTKDIFDRMRALSSGNVLHHNSSFSLLQLPVCSFLAPMKKYIKK